jgi:hypothetical protein
MGSRKYRVELEALSGPMDGHTFCVGKQRVAVGRGTGNDVCLALDGKVAESAQLIFLGKSEGLWMVRSGTGDSFKLNGWEVPSETEVLSGQIIKVGDTELLVTELEPAAAGKKAKTVKKETETVRSTPQQPPVSSGEKKICKGEKCGAVNDANAKWCWACGRKL